MLEKTYLSYLDMTDDNVYSLDNKLKDEVKKLHNRFTKYPLDLLYYIADYKMHGNESYAYNVENIRDMIYDNVDISMFDDDLIADTFIHHLVKGSIGKAIAARCELQDKNIYTNMNTREEIVHTPLVTNPPEWFKKILIDDYFIRNCLDINGIGHITSYILAKCGISADYIFKVVNGSSNNITNSMAYTFNVYENMFSTRDWDGGIFNLNGIHPGFIGIDRLLFIGTRAVEDEIAAEVEVIINIGKLLLLSARFLQSHLHIIDFDLISEVLSIFAVNPELDSLSGLRCHGLLRDVHLESRVALQLNRKSDDFLRLLGVNRQNIESARTHIVLSDRHLQCAYKAMLSGYRIRLLEV